MDNRAVPPPGYRTQSDDTDYATEQRQFALWATLAPHERMAMLSSWCEAMWRAKIRGLAQEHPDAGQEALELLEAEQRLGVEIARQVLARARELGIRP
jgi:hypothetical protein